MFPIVTTRLEDLAPALQELVLQIVNKAQPQANPFLLHTLGISGADRAAIIDTLWNSIKSRKPVIVASDRLQATLPDVSPEQAQAATYRLLQMLLEKRANIVFDNGGVATQQLPLLRYATASGYKVSLCPASTTQIDASFLPACKALGATLYELANDGDNESTLANAETLGERISKAI